MTHPAMTQAHCRSCRVPILWLRTPRGKAIPLDVPNDPNGNLVIEGKGAKAVAVTFAPLLHAGRARYLSHFVTCPQAGEWRK